MFQTEPNSFTFCLSLRFRVQSWHILSSYSYQNQSSIFYESKQSINHHIFNFGNTSYTWINSSSIKMASFFFNRDVYLFLWNNLCLSVQNLMLSHVLPKHVTIKIYKTITCLLFCNDVSHWGNNRSSWGSRIGCWGRYLKSPDISGGNCIVRSFLFELHANSIGEQINENDDRSVSWLAKQLVCQSFGWLISYFICLSVSQSVGSNYTKPHVLLTLPTNCL
jgi:hypothetical protein